MSDWLARGRYLPPLGRAEGVDRRTGRRVWQWARPHFDLRQRVRMEMAARAREGFRSDAFTRVLEVEPLLVVESPSQGDDAPLPLAVGDAARRAVALCEALAEVHAAGFSHGAVEDQAAAPAPGGVRLAFPSHRSEVHWQTGEVGAEAAVAADVAGATALVSTWTAGALVAPPLRSVAALAAFAADAARDEALRARAAAVPRVDALVRPPTDWDRVVALAEALLAQPPAKNRLYATLPLAAALHQRACLAFARGDVASARDDLDRAVELDADRPYLVSRAAVRLARGELDGAIADVERALAPDDRPPMRERRFGGTDGRPSALDDATRARADAVVAKVRSLRGGA